MLFYEIINDHPAEDPALICQDKMLTYGEVREEVTLWAAHLQSSGVCKGDKVGLFSKNCNEFVIAYLAIIKAGGVVVPFNFQLAAPEVAYIVQDAGMSVMVTRQKLKLDAALQECGCGPLKQLDFEDMRQPVDRSYEDIAMDDNDNCAIIYTSGTTGHPKGAMLSHRNLVANAKDFTQRVLMYSSDKTLCVLPMYHCFAWTVSVACPLLHGCCIVVQENYTLAEALRLIQRYEITQFAGVPTMIQMFEKGADSGQLASVRFFISGGASLPQKLAKDFKKKFGKTFGANEFLKYKDTLKKNDYKDCDLLCSKDITATGVYYVDYAELNKKGDYINYIMEYKFSDAGEKVYLKACAAGGYKINNEKVYSEWKKAHAEQMINN